ncbi:MAG: hypothetical protein QOE55_4520, partial [Acidobacteriaceae bacterium]|nr:hypothetical protein [Acidobacteriaceae bacterium]
MQRHFSLQFPSKTARWTAHFVAAEGLMSMLNSGINWLRKRGAVQAGVAAASGDDQGVVPSEYPVSLRLSRAFPACCALLLLCSLDTSAQQPAPRVSGQINNSSRSTIAGS